MTCAALIVAGGRGSRFGATLPKQYAPVCGIPLIRRTVQKFLDHPDVNAVRVVIHPDDIELYDSALDGLSLLDPVFGGETRQESVLNGLESLVDDRPDIVLVHDAARPFVSNRVISSVIEALGRAPGALPALPLTDTIKRSARGLILETVDRSGLYRAQTPQGFRYDDILRAHRGAAGCALTDDAAVMEKAGLDVLLVEGCEENFKVTTPEDHSRAERLVRDNAQTRVGTGFDVHRFVQGESVTLCGVEIPHEFALEGHSDADVALHALTDALLGAIGAGDIGLHFPPSDPRWKGAASKVFLEHAVSLVREKGGSIVNVDVTLICESPRIGPHRSAMIAVVADVLGIDADRVSVKATTTEGLGFTGRKEGVAAQALANLAFLG
ncbi:MAG: bifunctional 2-C-methyl-D-erythritol 4-phosphate cytidylyltransferase/2-C-methyl-D-erythritol 2,4-cyclodiphosphate synthase [Rhodospirillales bacterium]|nr:bifunctional 2-C-methyl-D-erythritol 4-phosphate cytidylyltransferase/2-C-methyl-D-erythritol 2,4-cyclodiphosphate synthase [Rhodospirillales bacterium]